MSASLHASRVVVDLGAYAHNLGVAWHFAGTRRALAAVIKANGYGLGAVPLARRAQEVGAAMLAVATLDEGVELRDGGIEGPILILIQPAGEAFQAAVDYSLTLMLCDLDAGKLLGDLARKAGRVLPVHCMVDTGMNRQGFSLESAVRDIPVLARIAHLNLEGIATHFPIAERVNDAFTLGQIEALKGVLARLDEAGVPYDLVHGANSAGVINYGDSIFNLVRPGIMSYGVWPTEAPPESNPLRPVVRWVTPVSQVRAMAPGATVSYGRTYTSQDGMCAAMLSVGYADGYRLALSNKAEVLIRGQRCPIRGRVCMDQMVVDVSHVAGVVAGDEAVLLGKQGSEEITVEELATLAGTIPYEILTGIGPRVLREYV
jgi:alanine racemase